MSAVLVNNVRVTGLATGPTIVFSHGFGCDQHMWRHVAPAFEDEFRVVVFDHVGAGGSDLSAYDAGRYSSLDGYVADVVAICEELDLHDAVFVGHSVACGIGVLASLAVPDRIGRLVLVAPSPRFVDDDGYVGGFSEDDVQELLASMDGNYLGWSQSLAPTVMGRPDRPELGAELTASFCRVDPEIARQFARVTFLSDTRADLPKVTVPTLVLQCSDDALAPLAVGTYVHEAIAGSELRVLAATGHCPNLSAPIETTQAILDFVRGWPPATMADLSTDRGFAAAPCGLAVTDAAGRMVRANADLAGLAGVGADALADGRTFVSLLSTGSRLYFETYVLQLLLLQGEARGVALTLITADGGRRPVLVNAAAEPDGAMRFAVFDASGRIAYEQELLAAKRRAEDSDARAVALATTLQQVLIPPVPPVVPGLDVAAAYRPAGTGLEVGGDFYGVFETAEDEWVVVIGDVSGKGAAAASVTALARFTIRAASARDPSPAATLATLDEGLAVADTGRFCTAVVLRLRQTGSGWRCRIAVGGHSLPLLLRPDRPVVEVGVIGSLIGAIPDAEFTDVELALAPGDLLVLCTDGVSEGRRGHEFFGDERTAEILLRHRGDAAGATEDLLAEVLAFQDDRPRDDIAIVAVALPV